MWFILTIPSFFSRLAAWPLVVLSSHRIVPRDLRGGQKRSWALHCLFLILLLLLIGCLFAVLVRDHIIVFILSILIFDDGLACWGRRGRGWWWLGRGGRSICWGWRSRGRELGRWWWRWRVCSLYGITLDHVVVSEACVIVFDSRGWSEAYRDHGQECQQVSAER